MRKPAGNVRVLWGAMAKGGRSLHRSPREGPALDMAAVGSFELIDKLQTKDTKALSRFSWRVDQLNISVFRAA
jgi:hypothetical protein